MMDVLWDYQSMKKWVFYVKNYATEILGNIGDDRVLEPLIIPLRDEYTIVKEYAAVSLGKLGDKRSISW